MWVERNLAPRMRHMVVTQGYPKEGQMKPREVVEFAMTTDQDRVVGATRVDFYT